MVGFNTLSLGVLGLLVVAHGGRDDLVVKDEDVDKWVKYIQKAFDNSPDKYTPAVQDEVNAEVNEITTAITNTETAVAEAMPDIPGLKTRYAAMVEEEKKSVCKALPKWRGKNALPSTPADAFKSACEQTQANYEALSLEVEKMTELINAKKENINRRVELLKKIDDVWEMQSYRPWSQWQREKEKHLKDLPSTGSFNKELKSFQLPELELMMIEPVLKACIAKSKMYPLKYDYRAFKPKKNTDEYNGRMPELFKELADAHYDAALANTLVAKIYGMIGQMGDTTMAAYSIVIKKEAESEMKEAEKMKRRAQEIFSIDIEIESQLFKKGDSAPSDPVTNDQDNDKQGTEEEEQDEDEGQDELPRPELPSSDSLKSIVDEDGEKVLSSAKSSKTSLTDI